MRYDAEIDEEAATERDERRARRAAKLMVAKREKTRARREVEEKALLVRLLEKYGNPEDWSEE